MVDRELLLKALAAKARRHADVSKLLEDPAVAGDHNQVKVLGRELGTLAAFARAHDEIVAKTQALAEARELLDGDPELAELAELEIAELEPALDTLWDEAEGLLADDDELADRDVMLEIRAGVGGDEAALFAGDLFEMYRHFCGAKGLKIEVLEESAGEVGGFKELVAEIHGAGAYRHLRFESGGHRVQRVPKTESQGRIHTSAATVAVLPKAEDLDIQIDWEKDVREDKMRAGGPGGQKVNKTESAIRLTHLETGITVHIQDEKSQHKNRAKARTILATRVFDHFQQIADKERAAERKGMVGSGDRSARIRTYNFPQSRVTDHRLEGEDKNDNLESVILGGLDGLHERLRRSERAERLRALAEAAGREDD